MENQSAKKKKPESEDECQKNGTEKFLGLEFLEQERLKSTAELEAMLEETDVELKRENSGDE